MKQDYYKEYDGEWEYKQTYRQKKREKKGTYYKKITYPWKNHQKSFRST